MNTIEHASEEALAAQLGITFDGRRYAYREFRYDHFDDAANYARIRLSRPDFVADKSFVPRWSAPFWPTDEDLQLMKPFGISYVQGYYNYGAYRYDQLESAIAYASRHVPL
jgi:hypothetical protein